MGKTTLESVEQQAVIKYCQYQAWRLPNCDKIFHIPNGGKRSMTEAIRFKKEGVKAGVPDLFLPIPMNGYSGLFIEMKKADRTNRPTQAQKEWQEFLTGVGYKSVICYGYEEAVIAIQDYYGVPKEEQVY